MQQNKARPKTRRNKRQRLIEGDDDALDTGMVERTQVDLPTGSYQQRRIVPVRLENPGPTDGGSNASGDIFDQSDSYGPATGDTDVAYNIDLSNESEIPTITPRARQRKDQAFYMQEFVSRVDYLLQALLSREALPDGMCGKCNDRLGRWRCRECFLAKPLCRSCMRHTHMDQPFHRIEQWTGTFFQHANLWQVGIYIRLYHKDSTRCQYLEWQENQLESFQEIKDKEDEVTKEPNLTQSFNNDRQDDCREDADANYNDDAAAAADDKFLNLLDRLYDSGNNFEDNPNFIMEEDDDIGLFDPEADICNEELNSSTAIPVPAAAVWPAIATPLSDGLNNPYVRIIHTNGVHHLPLVSCSCSGDEGLSGSLIYAGLMPTSFIRVKTLFSLAVLDQFRYSNLEMKASAYQFFQMLRRITLPMAPGSVINFYHELRRLSRLWRWMKKLKWAGFGHKEADPMNVTPGELGIFCPACPQPAINLPDDWSTDKNKWVYRRFFVADGNFKADHVKQKSAAPDLWLSDGGGMMTRRAEYKEFLLTATERLTVSNNPVSVVYAGR